MNDPQVLPHDWFPRPLPPNVVLGERTWLHSAFAFVHYRSRRPCGLRVGHDSGMYIGTMFDVGPRGEVEIGNYCAIAGPIISTNNRIVIGDYCLISYHVVLADSFAAVPPDFPPNGHDDAPADEGGSAPPESIVVGENAWIGARAVLLQGARLGEGAIVGAAAVVDFEVPPYAIVAGNPARVVGWARPKGSES